MPMELMLVFLPGLGANHRLFENQTAAFPNSYAVDCIDLFPKETLEECAVRLAESIRVEQEDVRIRPLLSAGCPG